MKPELYCLCYKRNINLLSLYNQKNLMVGSISYDTLLRSKLRQSGFLFDDIGNNISDLNSVFGSLTGLYWVWKNTNHEFLGTHTYRLFWNFGSDYNFEPNTLYVPEYFQLDQNILDQYAYCHGYQNFEVLSDLINKNKTLIKYELTNCITTDTNFFPFNMFIAENKIFNAICTILFEILFEMYENHKNYVLYQNGVLRFRTFDFFAERVLHIIFHNINYFFPYIKLKQLPIINIEHNKIKEEDRFKI